MTLNRKSFATSVQRLHFCNYVLLWSRTIAKLYNSLPYITVSEPWHLSVSAVIYTLHRKTVRYKYLCSPKYHTYLLTPWSRVLLEKLTGSATSQEIPRIFGTRSFLTVPTSARHLSLSWANSIQSPQLPSTSWRSILILFFHLRLGLPNGLFPSGLPTRTLCTPLPSPYTPHAPSISFFSILPPAQYWVRSTVH